MDTKKKVLFIDRDGTLVIEPPVDYQLDSLEKLEFYPKVFRNLGFVRSKLDFEFVMVTNQDGLGTSSFPEETFWPAHNLMLKTLAGEGIAFDDILIDRSFPEDNAPTRKPRTGMLTKYIDNPDYDLAGSFVIGDRPTDVELAKNLGCRAIYLQDSTESLKEKGLENVCALATTDWDQIAEFLFAGERKAEVRRTTKETDIYVALNLDGSGICDISTGLGFFDHMLEQIGKHRRKPSVKRIIVRPVVINFMLSRKSQTIGKKHRVVQNRKHRHDQAPCTVSHKIAVNLRSGGKSSAKVRGKPNERYTQYRSPRLSFFHGFLFSPFPLNAPLHLPAFFW